jgi:N4-gp56 family major capsid protein
MSNDASTSKSYPIGSADPLTEEIWSQKTHIEAEKLNFFNRKGLTAEDKGEEDPFKRPGGPPIVTKSEFGKKAGQKLNLRMRQQLNRGMRLDEDGATTLTTYTRGTNYAVGYEEALVYRDCQVWLDKLKHFVAMDSPDINQHRTSIEMEPEMKAALSQWITHNEEEIYVDGMLDGSAYIAQQDSLTSAVTHPHTYRISGANAVGEIGETHIMSAVELRRIMRFCIVKKLSPIDVDGEEAFVVLLSSALVSQLLNDEEFQRVVSQAGARGADNPLISGSIGKFYNLYLFQYERNRTVTSYDNVEQVMILGSNAVAVGYGSEPRFLVRNEDGYGDRFGRGIARIIGVGRMDFADKDDTDLVNQSSGLWQVYKDQDEFDG